MQTYILHTNTIQSQKDVASENCFKDSLSTLRDEPPSSECPAFCSFSCLQSLNCHIYLSFHSLQLMRTGKLGHGSM